MRLPAGPERERARGRRQEGPAVQVGRGGEEGVDQGAVARAEPVDEDGVVRLLRPDRLLARLVHRRRPTVPEVGGGPAVHMAGVQDEVPQPPLRAGRDGGVELGAGGGVGEQAALVAQGVDVCGDLHDRDSGSIGGIRTRVPMDGRRKCREGVPTRPV